jgi:hypothetical protein
MCKNIALGILTDNGDWTPNREDLLPKNLRFKIAPDLTDVADIDERVSVLVNVREHNRGRFVAWCAGRTLSIDRENAKKLLNQLGLSQSQNPFEKAKIAMAYRCVSLIDCYWVRQGQEDSARWEDINLFNNSLNKAVALLALKGTSFSLEAKHGLTAEITTIGSYAKGWFRVEEGRVPYLYKTYGGEKDEVEREVCASNIIDCFNIYGNVKYEYAVIEGVKCARCKVMTDERKGIIHAADFNIWCDAVNYALIHYKRDFAQMMVVDYLIANRDRHGYNWGFFQSMNTGEILGLHDLYDHNNAFDYDCMTHEAYRSVIFPDKTMKQCAMDFLKFSELRNTKRIKPDMFPGALAYETFVKRCDQLGIDIDFHKYFSI